MDFPNLSFHSVFYWWKFTAGRETNSAMLFQNIPGIDEFSNSRELCFVQFQSWVAESCTPLSWFAHFYLVYSGTLGNFKCLL